MNIIISIGGTGTKCTEAVCYLMAANFFDKPEQYQIFIVDKDSTCGNTARCHHTIGSYHNLQGSCAGGPFAQPVITEYNWCFDDALAELYQIGHGRTLKNTLSPSAVDQELMDLVYSPQEQNQDLEYGFYGHPSLGSAIFDAVTSTHSYQESDLFRALQNAIHNGNDQINIFLIGSIFGGTGASVFPNIAKSIRDTFCKDQETGQTIKKAQDMIKISGVLLLPYFTFPAPGANPEGELNKVVSGEFFKKTAVALKYYHNTKNFVKNASSPDAPYTFDSLYVMGLHPFSQTCNANTPGGKDQVHAFHVVDLFAALSSCSFFNNPAGTPSGLQIFTPQLTPSDTEMIDWNHLPDSGNTKRKLLSFARFSLYLLSYLQPLVNQDLTSLQKDALMGCLYGKKLTGKSLITDVQLDQLRRAVNDTADFCKSFLIFLTNVQNTRADSDIQLCHLFHSEVLSTLLTKLYQNAPFAELRNLCYLDSLADVQTGENYSTIEQKLRDSTPDLQFNKRNPAPDVPRRLLSYIYQYCSI